MAGTIGTSSSDHSTLRLSRLLLKYALRRPTGSIGLIVLLALKSALEVLKPWPMKVLVDNVLSGKSLSGGAREFIEMLGGAGSSDRLLLWCIAATAILFLIGWLLSVSSTLVGIAYGQRMVYDLAADLFAHLQKLSLRFHSRTSPGDLMRRVTGDTACVSTIIRDALLPIVAALITLAMMFSVMWRLSPTLTLLAMAVAPMMVITLRCYARPMTDTSYAQFNAEGELYDIVHDSLSSIPLIQTFAREDFAQERFKSGAGRAMSAAVTAMRVQLRFKILIGLATAVGTAAILSVGTQQVLSGQLTVGVLLVFLAYLASLYSPLEAIMYTSSMIESAAGSAKRVVEILEVVPDVHDRAGAVALPQVRGHVQLQDVWFGYHSDAGGDSSVLRGVSIEARPGELIALVGPSGAGKSTLLSLLPRLIDPQRGRVLIDGHDLRESTLASLRRQIAIVQQEPFLFPTSIAQNIAYGRPHATPAEIEAAARVANAHSFIEQLPFGYDTIVGERGATLSGGERQRLAIARAVLIDARILILDEPTSALDAQTEHAVMEALSRISSGRTVFVIAHRLSTVRRADRIFVLKDGIIVESGTHESLLASAGVYAQLHFLQNSGEPQEEGKPQ